MAFKEAYLTLGVNVTPKVHILLAHVVPYLTMKGEKFGLGLMSEQHFESVHHDFAQTWSRFKVSQGNERYGERLKKALVTYNSLHQGAK